MWGWVNLQSCLWGWETPHLRYYRAGHLTPQQALLYIQLEGVPSGRWMVPVHWAILWDGGNGRYLSWVLGHLFPKLLQDIWQLKKNFGFSVSFKRSPCRTQCVTLLSILARWHWSYSTRICRKPISCGKASALCFSFNISCHYWITVLHRSVLRESLARQRQLCLINKVCIYRFNNIVKGKMSSGVTRTSNLNIHQRQDNHQLQKDCITC